MPEYSFYDTVTCSYFDKWFDSYKDVQPWLDDGHQHINWLPSAPPTADPVKLGRTKTDDNFKDLLKTIKKGNPKSTVNI